MNKIVVASERGLDVDFSFKKSCHWCKHAKGIDMGDVVEVQCDGKRVRSWNTCQNWEKEVT